MSWCFAIINNRLKGRTKFYGHCYVRKDELKTKTKEELRCIDADTRKGRIIYRNKRYKVIKK